MFTFGFYRHDAPDEKFLKTLFGRLRKGLKGQALPEFVDTSEPASEPLKKFSLPVLAGWVSEPADMMFLSRKSPKLEGYVLYDNWEDRKFDGHVFVWTEAELAEEFTPVEVAQFLTELCEELDATYGYLTTETDRDKQNHLVKKSRGRIERGVRRRQAGSRDPRAVLDELVQ